MRKYIYTHTHMYFIPHATSIRISVYRRTHRCDVRYKNSKHMYFVHPKSKMQIFTLACHNDVLNWWRVLSICKLELIVISFLSVTLLFYNFFLLFSFLSPHFISLFSLFFLCLWLPCLPLLRSMANHLIVQLFWAHFSESNLWKGIANRCHRVLPCWFSH